MLVFAIIIIAWLLIICYSCCALSSKISRIEEREELERLQKDVDERV